MKLIRVLVMLLLPTMLFAAESKPNFVFLLVDDLGWGDFGCYGAEFNETPNIDKLASQGMMFSNGYAACTVCSPSRAAILSGCYPARLHLTDWIAGHKKPYAKLSVPDWKIKIDHERILLPEALKEAGYATAFLGKWHLMPIGQDDFDQHYPTSHGFDVNIGGREWGQPKGPGKYFSPFDMPNLDNGKPGDFLTDKLTDAAVDYLDKTKRDKPFLMYFAYYTLHGPIMSPPELVKKYTEKAKTFENKKNEYINPARAGMVESLDQSVGRIMAKLEQMGVAGNTVVILTGDNGGNYDTTTAGLKGYKGFSHEGGTREPFVVNWPGRTRAGSMCNEMVIGTDFYPTMLEMAGLPLKPDQHMDGISIVPLLTGSSKKLDRDVLYWHYPHYHRTKPYGAIRHRDWKLIEFFEDGALELYNLKNDPYETKNLAAEQPEKAQHLLKELVAWRKDVGAQMMPDNPKYDPNYKKPKPRRRKGPLTKLGKVSASTFERNNWPEDALDGSRKTRWAGSNGSVPQWWQLEFTEVKQLKGVNIFWKNRTWFSYQVEISLDGKKWDVVADQKGSHEVRIESKHRFDTEARFLRVTVDALGSGWVSFTELVPLFAE
ncbi:MAG: sulfatase-like hydrolase/transferase [Kiritimatiellae bacterium]|jgi:arylsulfatase A|nr:sulfatase-like hydrolase/transferase [Kiritimatiellia bacterium]